MNKAINTAVIYHYNEDNGEYTMHFFRNTTAHNLTKTAPSGNGFISADMQKIRIFTRRSIDISTGDYILACTRAESLRADITPNKDICKKVVAFSDNRIGCRPHWRIDAE